jgi:hypothetical protein
MPQVQPGQVMPGQAGAPKLYGVDKPTHSVPFQQKLMNLFKAQDFVIVKNITAEPIHWQYMPDANEQEGFSEDGMQRIITRQDPEVWYLGAGEAEAMVGQCAYRALDTIYKTHMANSTLKRFSDPTSPLFNSEGKHLPKNFNFADGGAQDDFLTQAYLGKATPSFDQNSTPAPVAAPQIQPMTAQATAPVNTDAPQPNRTEGAPLQTAEYAEPDIEPMAIKKAKELANANASKK